MSQTEKRVKDSKLLKAILPLMLMVSFVGGSVFLVKEMFGQDASHILMVTRDLVNDRSTASVDLHYLTEASVNVSTDVNGKYTVISYSGLEMATCVKLVILVAALGELRTVSAQSTGNEVRLDLLRLRDVRLASRRICESSIVDGEPILLRALIEDGS